MKSLGHLVSAVHPDLILFVTTLNQFDKNIYSLVKDKKHLIIYNKSDLFNNNDNFLFIFKMFSKS